MEQESETQSAKRLARPKVEHRPTFRQWAYLILEEGQTEGGVSRVVEMLLIALIVSNTIAVILETVPELYNNYHWAFSAFEQVTVYIFAVEYFFRLWSSVEDPRIGTSRAWRGRLRFALRPMMIVDFLSFALISSRSHWAARSTCARCACSGSCAFSRSRATRRPCRPCSACCTPSAARCSAPSSS